jgi:uncharacterized delta-60 repeat protein
MLLKAIHCAAAIAVAFLAPPAHAADGAPDPSFGTDGVTIVPADGVEVLAIVPREIIVLPDGRILLGGGRHTTDATHPPIEPLIRGMLVRLDDDGMPDATFGNTATSGLVELPNLVPDLRIQALEGMVRADDGSIFATGTALANGPSTGFIVKLDAEGNLDPAFGEEGVATFADIHLHAIAIDSHGRPVATGEHILDFNITSTVVRLTPDGDPDPDFGTAGVVSIPWTDADLDGYLEDVEVTPDDRVVVAGRFAGYGPGLRSDFAIARLGADGSFDTSFSGTGWRVFNISETGSETNGIDRLLLSVDGRISFAGYTAAAETYTGLVLGRLLEDGSTDANFGDPATPGFLDTDLPSGARGLSASALVAQGDGKLLVSATWFAATGKQDFYALRTTPDGLLDTSFATDGVFEADLAPDGAYSDLRAMALQPDGRIVLGGRIKQTTAVEVLAVDLAAMRLLNESAAADRIFASGFEEQ